MLDDLRYLLSLLEDEDNPCIAEDVGFRKKGTEWVKVSNSRSGGSGRSLSLHSS